MHRLSDHQHILHAFFTISAQADMETSQSESEHQEISTNADMETVQLDNSANQEIEGY